MRNPDEFKEPSVGHVPIPPKRNINTIQADIGKKKPVAAAAKTVPLLDAWRQDLIELQDIRRLSPTDQIDEAIFYLNEAIDALEKTGSKALRIAKEMGDEADRRMELAKAVCNSAPPLPPKPPKPATPTYQTTGYATRAAWHRRLIDSVKRLDL